MVSIIIPVYKVEQYLRQCIESVLGQTYRNIQVILVDDGSPDSCGAICDEYAAKDSRVLALHKENGGVSSARNHGLHYATGDYVTFCDSDDLYAPDWIEALVEALQTHQADIAVGNHMRILEDGTPSAASENETGITEITLPRDKAEFIFNKTLTPAHGWEIWSRLFRMDIIRRENIRFCENCGNFAEDLGFTLMCTLFADRVVSIENAGYRYRLRAGSMMHSSVNNPKLNSLQAVCSFCGPAIQRAFEPDMAELFSANLQFFLVGNQFCSAMWESQMEPEEFRSYIISTLEDWPAMKGELCSLLKKKNLGAFLPRSRRAEVAAHLHFLLGGSWTLLRLQCKLIRTFRRAMDGGKLQENDLE